MLRSPACTCTFDVPSSSERNSSVARPNTSQCSIAGPTKTTQGTRCSNDSSALANSLTRAITSRQSGSDEPLHSRSEQHTYKLQSLIRNSKDDYCNKKHNI